MSEVYGYCDKKCKYPVYQKSEVDNLLENKVDKESGKGLSTNDYTTADKNKLNGIATGANKTTVENKLNSTSTANALSAYQGNVLNQKFNSYMPLSGGTLKGNIIPNTNEAYDLGYPSKRFLTIYAKEFNGTNFYGTNIDVTKAWISNKLEVDGDIVSYGGNIICSFGNVDIQGGDGEGNLFVNNGSIKSANTYDNENVTNASNMYITSNGWIRRTTGSSKRWKTDITEEIEDRLNPEALYKLPIKQFKYKDNCISKNDVRKGKNILGFIAEDVAEIYEAAAQYDEKGNVEMWNAQVIIPAMLKLIQGLKKEVEELKK